MSCTDENQNPCSRGDALSYPIPPLSHVIPSIPCHVIPCHPMPSHPTHPISSHSIPSHPLPWHVVGVVVCPGDYQFGGNAQAITKGRWLHHTSFLWSFDPANMLYLQMPEKRVCTATAPPSPSPSPSSLGSRVENRSRQLVGTLTRSELLHFF